MSNDNKPTQNSIMFQDKAGNGGWYVMTFRTATDDYGMKVVATSVISREYDTWQHLVADYPEFKRAENKADDTPSMRYLSGAEATAVAKSAITPPLTRKEVQLMIARAFSEAASHARRLELTEQPLAQYHALRNTAQDIESAIVRESGVLQSN